MELEGISTGCNIPEDVMTEILAILPVKSTLNPFFDDHCNLCSKGLRFYGPCNGIICVFAFLGRSFKVNDYNFIALWNPATREINRLLDSNIHHRDDGEMDLLDIGFGFDSRNNDYKVIRIIAFTQEVGYLLKQIGDPVVEVYSSRADSWRKLDVELPKGLMFWPDFSTYLSGFYYWWAMNPDHEFILSFELATEVFEEIPAPDIGNASSTNIVKLNDTIAVVADVSRCDDDFHCKTVCMLNIDGDGQKKTWTKLYEIRLEFVPVLGLLSSSEALMVVESDGGGQILALYNPSTQQPKNLQATYSNSCSDSFQMVQYVESLVSFKGAYELP